jgi:putative ABC transport system permease protein
MPKWEQEIRQRLSKSRLSPTRENAVIEEISQYLDDCYDELRASGVSESEAYQRTLAELSGSEMLQRELRRVERQVPQEPVMLGSNRRINMIADLWQDLCYAARGLRKQALLSTVVVATLSLGIGISAGVYTLINASALRARIDKDPDSFVRVFSSYTRDPLRPGRPGDTTLADYFAFRDRARSLRELIASTDFRPALEDDPSETRVRLTTCNFFALYQPERLILGRLLQAEDCSTAKPVAVLSETAWRNRFASDPEIVGKAIHFNGQPVTVIGVVPRFAGQIDRAIAWLPYTLETYLKAGENLLHPDEAAWLTVEGRLNQGFSRRDAAAELGLLAGQQDRLYPGRKSAVIVTDGSMIQEPGMGRTAAVWVITLTMAVLILVVLITCANVATLLLARAEARQQEVAIRLALGAGRARLIRMLLSETLLLACLAGPISLYFAYRLPPLLDGWLYREPVTFSLAPDWRVFSYLAALSLLSGLLAGLAPARQSLSFDLVNALKGRSGFFSRRAGGLRLRGLLVGAQVAISFMLLVGTGFFVRSYQQMAAADPGFNTRQVLATRQWMRQQVPPQGSWAAFHRELSQQLETLPGVQSVAYASRLPFAPGAAPTLPVQVPGQAARPVAYNVISPEFFTTLEIPLVSGRAFQEADPFCGKSCPVVVSQELARQFWPGQNPLGQTLQLPRGVSMEVIGVARDTSTQRVGEPDDPLLYLRWNPNGGPLSPLARFSGDAGTLARAVMTKVRETIPSAEVKTETIQAAIDFQLENVWKFGTLLLILGALALFLAAMGIYGVVSFAVSQRAKEMGIRLALGAQKRDIYRVVFARSIRPIAVGLLLGLALALSAGTALARMLQILHAPFAMNAYDPMAYVIAALLFSTVALLALVGPARRATRVDPMAALRDE